MKNRSTLSLIEMMLMLLVFAAAAALCLQTFAAAGRISRHSAALDRAVLEACNTAETLKGCGDWGRAADLQGGHWDGQRWTRSYEEGTVTAVPGESGHPLLERAEISVHAADGALLYTLSAAWQKGGAPHG